MVDGGWRGGEREREREREREEELLARTTFYTPPLGPLPLLGPLYLLLLFHFLTQTGSLSRILKQYYRHKNHHHHHNNNSKQKPTTYTCGSAGGKAVGLLPNDNGFVVTKLDVGCAPLPAIDAGRRKLKAGPGLGLSAG